MFVIKITIFMNHVYVTFQVLKSKNSPKSRCADSQSVHSLHGCCVAFCLTNCTETKHCSKTFWFLRTLNKQRCTTFVVVHLFVNSEGYFQRCCKYFSVAVILKKNDDKLI